MKDLELLVKVPADCISDLLTKGLESVISRCSIEFMAQTASQPEPKAEPESKSNSLDKAIDRNPMFKELRFVENEKQEAREKRVVKKLIKFVCMDCGEYNFAFIERENDVYKITCRGCRNEYEFRERELLKAEYVCEECGRENVYFTSDIENLDPDKDRCVCGHETKMRYNHGTGKFVSAQGV